MSELQNDGEPVGNQPEEAVENQIVTESDLATDSEGQHEEKPIVDEAAEQEKAKQKETQKIINQKHFEAKQAERDRDGYKQQLEQFQNAERERQAVAFKDIPPVPDSFDDDYDQKIQERDLAIRAQTEFNDRQRFFELQQQQSQQQVEAQRQQEVQQQQFNYNNRAVEYGITPEELKTAGDIVGNYGFSDDLVMELLVDSDGPVIVKHLAANNSDAAKLASMSSFEAGRFLDEIRSKASALKPKTSSAPAPADSLDGKAVTPDEGKYPFLKGAKFE